MSLAWTELIETFLNIAANPDLAIDEDWTVENKQLIRNAPELGRPETSPGVRFRNCELQCTIDFCNNLTTEMDCKVDQMSSVSVYESHSCYYGSYHNPTDAILKEPTHRKMCYKIPFASKNSFDISYPKAL